VKHVAISLMVLMTSSTLALADACTDLVGQADAALQMENLDPTMREQLQQLREVGRSGDLQQCMAANTGSLQQSTPARSGPGGHSCSKSPDTV
jgi:hypothetical protein